MKLNLWLAYANLRSGYGKLEFGLWVELLKLGVGVSPLGRFHPDFYRAVSKEYPDGLFSKEPAPADNITIAIGSPFNPDPWLLRDSRMWLYTMAETNRINPDWVTQINRFYERVLVPVEPLVQIMADSGVRVPVHVIPYGIGTERPLAMPRRPLRRQTRIILGYSLGDTRKGIEKTLFAFQRIFGKDPQAQLWIKLRSYNANGTFLDGCQMDNVTVLADSISERAWIALLESADMMVFPSYGEGIGLPPREAVYYTQMPAIATQWLGMSDVDRWGFPIRVSGMRLAHFGPETVNAEDAQWAEADLDHLVEQMTWVNEHPKRAIEIAAQGQEYLRQFTYTRMAEAVRDLVEATA